MVLLSAVSCGRTVVDNAFIDRYMAAANGEYIKVYLLLLRLAGAAELSVHCIADRLEMTEKDVLRALAYWEKAGLIQMTVEDGDIVGMTINGIGDGQDTPAAEAAGFALAEAKPPAGSDEKTVSSRRSIKELQEDAEFARTLYIVEKYIGKTLKPKDIELFAWMYDELRFPEEVIEYLVEYCVDMGKTRTEYMQSVAMGWHESGIATLKQAKDQVRGYRLSTGAYYSVLKAFGIYGRAAVEHEVQYVDRWTGEMGFAIEVVLLACAEAMKKNARQPFVYTDRVLEKWKAEGIKSPSDVKRYQDNAREAVRRPEDADAAEAEKNRARKRMEESLIDRERDVLTERRAEVYKDIPDFEQVEAQIVELSAKRDMEILNGENDRAEELKNRIAILRRRKSGLLAAAGFPDDYLERV